MTFRVVIGVLLTFMPVACSKGPLEVRGSQSQTFRIAVGQELDLTVGTVGPGEYKAPPTISSNALRFLDVQFVGPYTPGGPNQLFRFRGQSRGTVLVEIEHSGNNPTIVDTVIVR
jgi:hypothetical protein